MAHTVGKYYNVLPSHRLRSDAQSGVLTAPSHRRRMPRRIPPFLFRSVRGRLVLLVAALILPVVSLACAMILQAYRNERASVANTLLSTTRAVCGVVNGEIDEADAILKALATSSALEHDDFRTIDAMARLALAGDDRWFVLLDVNAKQLLNTRLPFGTALPQSEFEPDFVPTMRQGERYVSNLRRSRATGELVLHVSRPYFRGGKLTYMLTVSIPPRSLANALDVDRYAPGNIVTVIDRTGTIVARSRSPGKFVGQLATPDVVKAAASRREGVIDSITLENIPVLAAFSRAKCGWSTVIGAPKAELYVSARRLLGLGVVGSVLLIFVAIAMAAWIGRTLVRSVDVLAADAEALAHGKTPEDLSSDLDETDFVAQAMRRTAATLLRRTRTLELLNRINAALVAERNLERIVQSVTDAGRELSGAAYGAFYYRVENDRGQPELAFVVSGTLKTAFAQFESPRDVPLFAPTFRGEGVIRLADVAADARFASWPASNGEAPLAVRSYLAVPVKGGAGDTIGGLFFCHPDADVFTQEAEEITVGLAAEAAIAIDNAKLYLALARELDAKSKAEAELREAQARLAEHARDLERKVEERTASLREAVTQMEEFSYTVSHDLRGPLRAMHAFADALLEDYGPKLDDTARDYLARIQRASRRMDQLTTDLLSYSRIVRAEVRLEPTDIDRIVQNTVEHYAELQPGHAHVELRSPLLSVLAHEPSLTQCVANLLTNAAKFVPPNEKPRITVRTERRGHRVRLWVEDCGIGIPPQFQGALFRIFERAPTSASYEGTGVGLAIVRKAAEKMGGTCGVESDGQHGSRFWIELAAAEGKGGRAEGLKG